MQIAYTGDEALLTIGTGPDHGQVDLYINDTYWRRFNTYTAQPGEKVLHIPEVTTPQGATSGTLEIRNRSDRHRRSTGFVFRFKQLAIIDTTYTDTTIDYTYDALSRLTQADYDDGTTVYDYGYDLAGNLVDLDGTTRTYNAANQMTNDGTNTLTYDANGNLISDGTNSYTWDRANRMLTAPNNTSYTYDGLGNRTQQTTNRVVTDYLLDLQPGLVKVLRQSDGTATDHFIHAPRGIHAMQNNTGAWQYTTQDGLGSVRSLIDATLNVSSVQNYAPYGEPFGTVGNFDTPFAFTGEQTDPNDLLFLRARYYNPSLGVFPSLDPFEGTMARPMSLNGYSWVEGNPIINTDPTGMFSRTRSLTPGLDGGGVTRNHGTIHPTRVPVVKTRAKNPLMCGGPGGTLGKAVAPGPISGKDPSPDNGSSCPPQYTGTRCQSFVSEVQCIIDTAITEMDQYCDTYWLECLLAPPDITAVVIDLLAAYYSGVEIKPRANWLPQLPAGGVGERHEAELYNSQGKYKWDSPALGDTQEAQDLRAAYGFKRPYFANTHHYFGYLKYAYYYSNIPGSIFNREREIQNLEAAVQDIENELQKGPISPDYFKRYRWLYEEGLNDLYIIAKAGDVARLVSLFGVDVLATAIETEWCAESESDIWSLDAEVKEFYNDFPERLWPENVERKYGHGQQNNP